MPLEGAPLTLQQTVRVCSQAAVSTGQGQACASSTLGWTAADSALGEGAGTGLWLMWLAMCRRLCKRLLSLHLKKELAPPVGQQAGLWQDVGGAGQSCTATELASRRTGVQATGLNADRLLLQAESKRAMA